MRDQLSEDIYFSCLRRNDNCNLSCRVLVSWRPHTLELHFELAKYSNQNGKSWRLDDVCLCVFAYCIDQTLSIFTNCTIYVYTYSCIKGKRECTYKFEETASIHRPVLGLRDLCPLRHLHQNKRSTICRSISLASEICCFWRKSTSWLSEFDRNLSDWLPENFSIFLHTHNMALERNEKWPPYLIITVQILN